MMSITEPPSPLAPQRVDRIAWILSSALPRPNHSLHLQISTIVKYKNTSTEILDHSIRAQMSASSEDIQWWLHQIEARLSLFDWSPVLAWLIDWTHALYQRNSNATKVRAILLNILMIFLASLPARFVSPQTASWAIRCALIYVATTWCRHRLYNMLNQIIRSVYRLYPPIELKSKMITIETGTACPRRPRHSMEGALHCPLCFWRSLPNSLIN